MRRSQQSAFANPVLVGAVTVLVVMVAVFLAYNANQGLPFVPTRQLMVDIGNGSNVVVGNDVREGGFRVGLVSAMKPIELPNGQVGAQLTLQLNQSNGKIPVDSVASIQPRSVLGLKFVDLRKGSSTKSFPDGAVLPISQTDVPVQFDDLNKIFDAKTRPAVQQNLRGFGDTFAARGSALNDTISNLPALFQHLEPVARYLSSPSTELTRFFNALNRFTGAISPVAQANSRLFTDMATTWAAISKDPAALESTIQQSPPTLDVSTDSLRFQQPFLVDFAVLGRRFQPATSALKAALPDINPALEAGSAVLPRTPQLNSGTNRVLQALKDLALAPGTNVALNALTATVDTLNPMIRYLGPYVTVCNSWTYFWTFFSDHVSEQTSLGAAQRALLNFANHQPNNVGAQGAAGPANGYPAGTPSGATADAEFLHGPAYGAAITPSGAADCETGQRGYQKVGNYFDPQHRMLYTDQHTPVVLGPTYTGRAHVPAGETFSRNPVTGPQTPYNPDSIFNGH